MINGYANEVPAHYDIICISGNKDIHKYLMKIMI